MTPSEVWQTAGAVLLSLGGGSAIVLAMSTWLGKVWANRLLAADRARYTKEVESLKAELDRTARLFQGEIDKTLFVTKTHFEAEFQLLRETWREVSAVRRAMSGLRPVSDYLPIPGPERQEVFKQRLGLLSDAVARLVQAVDDNSPFYPFEIHHGMERLILLAKSEGSDASESKDGFGTEGTVRGKANFDRYLTEASEVSRLIRERLASLTVRQS